MQKIIDFVKGMVAELEITESAGKKIINYIKSVKGEGTCSICKHRNEGDGIHGMFCELENIACEYEARCRKWEANEQT